MCAVRVVGGVVVSSAGVMGVAAGQHAMLRAVAQERAAVFAGGVVGGCVAIYAGVVHIAGSQMIFAEYDPAAAFCTVIPSGGLLWRRFQSGFGSGFRRRFWSGFGSGFRRRFNVTALTFVVAMGPVAN